MGNDFVTIVVMKEGEKQKEKVQRAEKLAKKLEELFPEAKTALNFGGPWELLVAVVLSAQCTDKKVNEVTVELFNKYRSVDDYANVDPENFAVDIKQTGFYKNKTKNILATAEKIVNEHDREVPDTMEELIALPGVARKTANIILQVGFGKVEGIPVDTHVKRFAHRFDLSDEKNTDKIEKDLMELLPQSEWDKFPYRVVEYGREIAPARKYDTSRDPLIEIYPPAAHKVKIINCLID